MKLLVDVGNSRIKWAFGTAGRFVAHGEALRDDEAGLRPLLDVWAAAGRDPHRQRGGRRGGRRILPRASRNDFHIAPVFAGSAATGAGVRNGYTDAGQLGVDGGSPSAPRYARYRAAVCVVDAGTATTIDLVTGSGEHQGGLILPVLDSWSRP